jgi:hypothetical protein
VRAHLGHRREAGLELGPLGRAGGVGLHGLVDGRRNRADAVETEITAHGMSPFGDAGEEMRRASRSPGDDS